MRITYLLVLVAGLATFPCWAAESQADEEAGRTQPKVETAGTNAPAETAIAPDAAPNPTMTAGDGAVTNGLRMNFRGAPLNLVLDYLSDAAGFIIDKQADLRGTVDVWSKHPVTREEAVELLHSNLRKNGYAVTRNGRILTIVKLDEAKTQDLPVERGADPDAIEKSEEVVIQTIPVRYANATQLMNNLQVLLPTSATLSANESANTLILVATKTDIRRMLKIIHSLDTSIASVSSVKVFPLKFADAKQLATVIQQLFTQQAVPGGGQGGNQRAQFFAMMRGGGPGGGGPGGPQAPNAPGTGANTAGTRVIASADEYSNSLIVSAAPELMTTITDIVNQIDQPVSEITELRVFRLLNADPAEIADQLMQLFPDDTRSNTRGSQNNQFRFFGGRGGANQTASTWTSKKTRVLAVSDPRTSSLIVSASGELMPQIADMVAQLDSSPAKKEKVAVFELQNANPQEVYQIMQDLFNRNNSMRNNNANTRGSLLGQNNPLTQRATQQQQNGSQMNSRFGNNSRTGGGTGGF